MTYHEFASEQALSEISRVLTSQGTFVVVDWAASGSGTHGPPVDERFSVTEAASALRQHGFTVEFEAVRPETFLVTATAD